MKCRIAMLPGSFDPPTNGHLNLIERSAKLYDKLYVVVADNVNKKTLFSAEERLEMMSFLLNGYENIEVCLHTGLIVEFAKEKKIDVMVRGVRALGDFSYEFELAMTNKQLYPEMEIMFMPTDPRYFLLRSSQIRELAMFEADISTMVPDYVAKKLKEKKIKNNTGLE